MKKAIFITIMLIVILSMLLTILPAYATPSTEISGKWRSAKEPVGGYFSFNVKKAGANAFLTMHNYAEYFEGDILGGPANIEQTINIAFHYSDPEYVKTLPTNNLAALRTWEPTKWNWHVDRTFVGTVLGVTGGFTMHLEAIGYGRIGNPIELEGTWVITDGTGGLENLHGQGTWQRLGTQLNEYEGQVHFDP